MFHAYSRNANKRVFERGCWNVASSCSNSSRGGDWPAPSSVIGAVKGVRFGISLIFCTCAKLFVTAYLCTIAGFKILHSWLHRVFLWSQGWQQGAHSSFRTLPYFILFSYLFWQPTWSIWNTVSKQPATICDLRQFKQLEGTCKQQTPSNRTSSERPFCR